MGGSSYSDDLYTSAKVVRTAATGVDSFSRDRDIKSGKVEEVVHNKLDPKGVVRESRDSEAHPTSNAIIVGYDVSGSMKDIPRTLQKKLPKLMSVLLTKGAIEHPQILMAAFGDVTCDRVPLQVGQFESGVEMDEDLDKMYLEGQGGPYGQESAELVLYFAAKKTSIDCFEKRGNKGYLFFTTDECCRDVSRDAVKKVFGDFLQEDISLEQIIKDAQEKYQVFMILPTKASGGTSSKIKNFWTNLLGQNVLVLDDEDLVCELIATTIGLCEETIDSVDDIAKELKLDPKGRKSLTTALSEVKSSRGLKAKVDGLLVNSGSDCVKTL